MNREEHLLSRASLLLGRTHGAIVVLLNSLSTSEEKIIKLGQIETGLRLDIERLYYPASLKQNSFIPEPPTV